jgi:hypothetical protein
MEARGGVMRLFVLALVAAVALAGCSSSDESTDPYAYTKKELYSGGFDLARLAGANDSQEFRVSDGSIAAIRVLVWVNATAGGATVTIRDPGGDVLLQTTETTERSLGLELGAWTVEVQGQPESAGRVHILVVRG